MVTFFLQMNRYVWENDFRTMQADRIDKALRMHIPIMTMSASDEVTDNLVGARAERCVTPLAARSWMGYDPGMPEPGAAKGWLLIIIARDNVDFNTRSAAGCGLIFRGIWALVKCLAAFEISPGIIFRLLGHILGFD